jgi:hypothetical protein
MANTLLTISMITREALFVLVNNLAFTALVNRYYDDKFAVDGAKIGDTLNVRKPPRYLGRDGQAIQIEDTKETSVPVQLVHQFGVDVQFSSRERALDLDDFSDRVLAPAMATIANKVDFRGMEEYKKVANTRGTPGTTPDALLTYLLLGVSLDNEAAPQDEFRSIVINPIMNATIVDALKGLFNQAREVGRQYIRGRMGTTAGMEWYQAQNVVVHTVGPLGGTPLVNGAGQSGTSLITDGWTAAAAKRLNEGDVFTIANVNAVNPQNRQTTGELRQFVVRADGFSDASGNLTLTIEPSIVVSGAEQSVDAAPADDAALTVLGAADTQSPQGLAFHRDAFTLACADLPVPNNADMAARQADDQLGLSVRIARDWNVETDQWPCRTDLLCGWATLRQELAARMAA